MHDAVGVTGNYDCQRCVMVGNAMGAYCFGLPLTVWWIWRFKRPLYVAGSGAGGNEPIVSHLKAISFEPDLDSVF
jgi:hypothetical protein